MKKVFLAISMLFVVTIAHAESPSSKGICVASDGDIIVGSFRFNENKFLSGSYPNYGTPELGEVELYKNDYSTDDEDHYESKGPQKIRLDVKNYQVKTLSTEKGYVYQRRSGGEVCSLYHETKAYDFNVTGDSSLKKIRAVCYLAIDTGCSTDH